MTWVLDVFLPCLAVSVEHEFLTWFIPWSDVSARRAFLTWFIPWSDISVEDVEYLPRG